jgi:hypothetical protein
MAPFPKAADTWLYCSLLSPPAALVVNVIAQVLLVRPRKGVDFLRSIVEGCLLGAAALALLDAVILRRLAPPGSGVALALLVNLPMYLALSYCYLGQTSIRIRIYSEIAAAGGMMSVREVERIYGEGRFTAMRVQRLVESGDIVLREGRYYVGRRKLVHAANLLFAAKQFLLGQKSEFQ